MAREWFTSNPSLTTLLREVEQEMLLVEQEMGKEADFIESINSIRNGDTVTTQILVPLDTRVEEVKVSLREGILTITTPLVSRTRTTQSTTQSVPVSVDGK